jgi:hypothetical protein
MLAPFSLLVKQVANSHATPLVVAHISQAIHVFMVAESTQDLVAVANDNEGVTLIIFACYDPIVVDRSIGSAIRPATLAVIRPHDPTPKISVQVDLSECCEHDAPQNIDFSDKILAP